MPKTLSTKKYMRWSIRYQLLLPLAVLLAGVVIMNISAALASANHATAQIELQIQHIVDTVQASSFPLTEKNLSLMKGFSGADYLLVTPEGSTVATMQALSDVDLISAAKSIQPQRLRFTRRLTAGQVDYLQTAIDLSRGPNAGAILHVFYPESEWRDAWWRAIQSSLLFGLPGSVLAFIVALVVAHRVTRGVAQLQLRTRMIAAGDFTPMPLPRANDELHDLASSVNEMARQLAEYQENLRRNERLRLLGQVSGGLAHQLRNAVAGAKLALQLHSREYGESESIEVALRQLAMMELYLQRFFALGKTGTTDHQLCDLRPILRETLELLRPRCHHAHIDLRFSDRCPDTPLTVRGDAGQLAHLFANIFTNAIEAAGTNGWVEAEIEQFDNSNVHIIVRDSGPGPAPEIAEKMFDPFITGKPDGIGLGLALARQIAEEHGGRIHWKRVEGQTRFEIEIPLAAAH